MSKFSPPANKFKTQLLVFCRSEFERRWGTMGSVEINYSRVLFVLPCSCFRVQPVRDGIQNVSFSSQPCIDSGSRGSCARLDPNSIFEMRPHPPTIVAAVWWYLPRYCFFCSCVLRHNSPRDKNPVRDVQCQPQVLSWFRQDGSQVGREVSMTFAWRVHSRVLGKGLLIDSVTNRTDIAMMLIDILWAIQNPQRPCILPP